LPDARRDFRDRECALALQYVEDAAVDRVDAGTGFIFHETTQNETSIPHCCNAMQ
jgi:hypothetical protein